jgi:hypothetical protein
MKKIIFSVAMVFALTATTGTLFAQSANTTPPGPTIQREPDLTNNNLPNPGNPQTQVDRGAAAQPTPNTTGTMGQGTTGIAPETEQGEGMDVDIDTGSRASGAVDVDVTRTTDADTDASGINETGENTGTYGGTSGTLPDTASNAPAMGLLGLLALGFAFVARVASKRR